MVRIVLMILVMVIFPIAYFASNVNKTAAQPDAEGYCCYLGGIRDAWTESKTKLTEAVLEQRDFTFHAEELQTIINQRENYLNILMQQLSQEPEDAGSGPSETGDFTSECVIATAAFGSNLAPQVQFLREFRDGHIMTTVVGSSFMNVFNSWYYSFSPQVATYERDQPWLQQTVRIGIQPLLSILQLSENGYSLFRGEPGSMTAGFIASSLIGAVYFTPLALFGLRKQSRMQSQCSCSIGGWSKHRHDYSWSAFRKLNSIEAGHRNLCTGNNGCECYVFCKANPVSCSRTCSQASCHAPRWNSTATPCRSHFRHCRARHRDIVDFSRIRLCAGSSSTG